MENDSKPLKTAGPLTRFIGMLDRRFVPIMEIAGYLLCAVIGAGFIASMWYTVEVTVLCEGTLAAPAIATTAPADGVVTEWLAKPGQTIQKGDPICVLDTSKEANARGRARHGLNEALSAMQVESGNQATATQIQSLLDGLGSSSETRTLSAPAAGVLVPSAPASRADLLRKGDVLARVVDTATLELTGTATGRTLSAAVGNPASVDTTWSANPLAGRVVKIDPGTPEKLTIRFENLPEAVRAAYLARLQASHLEIPDETSKAKVNAGQETLFRSLFGRH